MEKVLKNATLCYLRRGDEILLAPKLTYIGEGLFNGYGGGIEDGEKPEVTALRELQEESGVVGNPAALRKIAVADCHNTKSDGEVFVCRVHVYVLTEWTGTPVASEEMGEPVWFNLSAMPYAEMMPGDGLWAPVALTREQPIYAEVWYGPKQKQLLRPVEISDLPKDLL